jgi:RHS repeat-associated protein
VHWAASYEAWGGIGKLHVNLIDNPIRLQGQYADQETGLYYNRNRYFDSQVGAFITQDPIGLVAGENVYEFSPNTFGWSDPLGLTCFHGHHPFPKYLGGAQKQSLVKLSELLHKLYHKGLDKVAPRQKGKKFYDGLSKVEKSKVLDKFKEFTKAFDRKHGTSLLNSARENGFLK